MSPDLLYVKEVYRRVAEPTDSQIRAEYASRPELQEHPFDGVRDGLRAELQDRQEARLFAERSERSRKRHRVVLKASVGPSNPAPETVVAVVGGEPITWASMGERVKAKEEAARWKVYRAESAALERAIRARLLEQEAARKGVTRDEILRSEVAGKVQTPSEEDIAGFFAQYRSEFAGDLDASRGEIVEVFAEEGRRVAEEAFYERLRGAASVSVVLREPTQVPIAVSREGPSRGDPAAAVTIVEFGDFECPPCGRMAPIVDELLRSYGKQVRLVFRNSPLSIHPHARGAAEAAVAADAQGKFWPYAETLFRNQKALEPADLRRYAAEVGLDRERFLKALAGDASAAAVVRDLREARRCGARGTPTFFVNGLLLHWAAEADGGLRRAVDGALAAGRSSGRVD
jgi:protein-disulfide isomerase